MGHISFTLKVPQQMVIKSSVCPSLYSYIHQARPALPGERDMVYRSGLKFVHQGSSTWTCE